MKTNRSLWMVRNLVLALTSACIFAGMANAQAVGYSGKFTLPFEAQWGGMTLPAGTYSFTLGFSVGGLEMITVEQGARGLGVVMSQGHNPAGSSEPSALVVARSGGRARIVTLHAVELGTDFYYRPPKAKGRQIASAPELIQQIPVSANGK